MSAHSVDDSSRAAALSLLQASLAGRIIYNSKFFCIRTTLPGSVPKRAYYLDEFDVLRLSDLPNHIRMLRAAKGEAKGLIPVTKELFDVLVAAGISTEKVDDDSLKWAIIPGDHVRHMISMHVSTVERRKKHLAMVASHVAKHGSVSLDPNMKTIHDDEFSDGEAEAPDVDLHEVVRNPAFDLIDDSIVVVGRAKRGARDDPVMIFTLAEASLKSRVHSHQMANALMRRLNAVIDTSVYAITRRGDNSIQVHPAQHIKEHGVDCIKNHPIDVKTVALIPGISKIYDPNQEPKRVLEAKKEMAKMDVERAQRIAQGLPLEDEPTPGAAQFDSRGRPIENPRAYRYATLKVIIDEEEKRRQGRMIFGEAIADGAGGIPVLSTTRALCLMSGGIDSPVAAYNMMQRGCHVDLIHFLNSTSDTAAILRKLYLITQRLSIAQGRVELMVVDIAELQQAIVGVVQRLDRTVVYKQYMLLIAAAVSGYHLLITGDSVAQVASQTANNISTLYPHCPRAIMSPLAGTNKTAIMEVSERLGLFSLSAMEGADCCQYLMCKTGANLCIGPGKMRGYLAKIRVPDIPVRTVVFQNGLEVPSASRQFTIPFDSITVNHAITIQNLAENVAPRAAVLRRRAEAEADARLQSAAATNGSTDGAKAPSVHVDPTPSSTRPSRQSYLDSAAASIVDPAVVDAMGRAPVGNPNSVHTVGRVCRAAVEGVRHQLLSYLCPTSSVPFQLIFTSGGTEANNIAIQGLARALMRTASPAHASQQKTCVLYSCIAHPSIVEVAKNLAVQGVVDEAVPIPVTTDGTTDLAALTALLDSRSSFKNNADALDAGNTCRFTGLRQSGADLAAPDAPLWSNVLIAMDLVNHELGNLRDMEPITRIARSFGALLHVDACQALCKVEFDASPFDSVSVTAHKINGPIGVGALAMRSSLAKRVPAIMSGGSYDGGLRPGTLNAPGIIGFGAALSLPRDESTVNEAFDMLVQGVKSLRGVRLNGDVKKSSRRIVHVTLIGAPPDVAALSDLEIVSLFAAQFNVMLSTGAACSQSKGEAPGARANAGLYDALGLPGGVTLRVSLDHNTALRDVDAFLRGLRKVMRAPAAEGNSAAAS